MIATFLVVQSLFKAFPFVKQKLRKLTIGGKMIRLRRGIFAYYAG